MLDLVTAEPFAIVGLPIIDLRTQAVNGVMVARLRLHKVWNAVVMHPYGNNGVVSITDSTGMIVAHPNPSVIFRNIAINLL